MLAVKYSVFEFEGRTDELHDDSKLIFAVSEDFSRTILWKDVKNEIDAVFNQGNADYPMGYLKADDFEGELLLEGNDLVFGANILVKNALVELFDGYEDKTHEDIVIQCNNILQRLRVSDFDYFQLTMLMVYHQAYLTRFEENIELLLNLENKYHGYSDEIRELIGNTKLNRHSNRTKFVDRGHFKFDYAYLQFSLGYNYQFLKKFDLAINKYDTAYELWLEKNNEIYTIDIIKTLNNCSSIFYDVYELEDALDYSLKALNHASKSDNLEIIVLKIQLLGNTALRYMRLKRFDKAIEFAEKALLIAKSISNQNLICVSFISLAKANLHVNSKEAINVFYQAYNAFQKTNLDVTYLLDILFFLSILNLNTKQYQKSIKFYEEMKDHSKSNKTKLHNERCTFLETLFAIENNDDFESKAIYRLLNIFNNHSFYIQIRVLSAIYLVNYLKKGIFTKEEENILKDQMTGFAMKYGLNSLLEVFAENAIDINLTNKLKNNLIPLIEIRM